MRRCSSRQGQAGAGWFSKSLQRKFPKRRARDGWLWCSSTAGEATAGAVAMGSRKVKLCVVCAVSTGQCRGPMEAPNLAAAHLTNQCGDHCLVYKCSLVYKITVLVTWYIRLPWAGPEVPGPLSLHGPPGALHARSHL